MIANDTHVVLGASGGAGHAIASALHDAGYPTRAVNRSGAPDLDPEIEQRTADITDLDSVRRAVEGASVVYMAAQPAYDRWSSEFVPMLETVIRATADEDAKLVMVDNLYAYGPGHDAMTERSEHRATDAKGTVRIEMIEMLLAAHERGDLRVAIGQASDYFGPRSDNSAITVLAIQPAAGRGALRWMGSLDTDHSVAYLPDIARAYVTLGTSEAADGRAWILPHGTPVTGREFLDEVKAALGEDRKTGVVGRGMLRIAAPFHRMSRESLGVLYQWTDPWIADDSEFQATFGPVPVTPIDTAVKSSVDWYRNR
ncbi:MAG: NAD-dependent epimerase/dehydratase family protein [Acidimicrobiia bacterium]|nr:NAD-dependent epimerase/dehydratase family protein [Acidimicrobiia bacterium]